MGLTQGRHKFRSWREERERSSLQCVLAMPRRRYLEDPDYALYLVDIDIDEWNPFASLDSLVRNVGQSTDHVGMHCKEYFFSQDGVERNLSLLRDILA